MVGREVVATFDERVEALAALRTYRELWASDFPADSVGLAPRRGR